ncbi:chemotaxis protein CheZ [Cohaesibacter sp. ES.047]|uniref:protein phosphatase CheZ n=1 Tax=Cohaesibacter sp. ES.047 TaxID=1798205 RepID=UPI000BB76642|nr:protein phosphatase CheZ [Cohaesibacter sp. ES.047]SNY92437.1 chemotaxis protein CheZ [Cohaesibacter sp. ES.047]
MKSQQKTLSADKVTKLVTFLEHSKGEDVSLTDIMSLAEVMASSLESHIRAMDKTVYHEFMSIADEISTMKREISALRPADMRHNAIPDAGRELDAVVEATEKATNIIMSSAEEIMGADPSDAEAYQAIVNDKIIEIFEACSFQDITGQRISKVVHVLNVIDERVSTFIDRMKMNSVEDEDLEETEAERRKRELILHGPQKEGEGVNQSEVDAMLAELGFGEENEKNTDKSDQNDIDALFD